jgi:hypothetical protein
MINCRRDRKAFLCVLILAVFCVTAFSGCTTLRRKFIRKRVAKDAQEGIIPVLEPVDYPPVVYKPGEIYATEYSIMNAYFTDLWSAFGHNQGDKRERYLLEQIGARIDSMAGLLGGDKAAGLKECSLKVASVLAQLDKPQALRRYDLLRSDLKQVDQKIHREFRPVQVAHFLQENSANAAQAGPLPAAAPSRAAEK